MCELENPTKRRKKKIKSQNEIRRSQKVPKRRNGIQKEQRKNGSFDRQASGFFSY